MAKIFCPFCGDEIRFAPRLYGLPYCCKCGWRLGQAEKDSRQMTFAMPILAFLGLVFFYRTVVLGWPLAIKGIYLACWVVFPAVIGFLSWSDYRRIIVAEPQTVPPRREEWTARAASEYQPFLQIVAPRPIQITWKGWLRICIGAVCIALIYFVLSRLSSDFVPAGILIIIASWTNWNLIRQRWLHLPLFRSGSVVIGRVVKQRFQNIRIGMDMIGRYSLVEYEFHTEGGLPASGGGHDYSKSLFQDMPILIFYKKEDPLRNVALGCSLYEVKKVPGR